MAPGLPPHPPLPARAPAPGSPRPAPVADAAEIGLWEGDPAGGGLRCSEAWWRRLGYPSSEDAGRPPAACPVIHPDDRPRLRAALQAWADAPATPFAAVVRMLHRDGGWRSVQLRGGALPGPDGRPGPLAGIAVDIAGRQEVEQERMQLVAHLLESQQLEGLGLLAGSIAHDFNNLLSGVLSNAELALLDLPPDGPVPGRINQIKQAAMRMADLSREMLAYSGRGPFNVEHIDLNRVVSEMTNLLGASIGKRVRLGFELAAEPVIVKAEATQIRQVIMNLITNASDAIGANHGSVTLTTGAVVAGPADFAAVAWAAELVPGWYAYFEVRDTGSGMSPETLRRMFEPFFTTKPRGRGLGLAAVQGIVRNHRGALQIHSEPGRGTTIRVLLPFAAEFAAPAADAARTISPWQGSGTVLLVDDEEIVRDTVATQLTRLQFDVLAVADGDEACRRFRHRPDSFSALLLDATIPGCEGAEVVRQVRSLRPDLPVLLTSGYSEKEVMQHYGGVRIDGFVPKPVELTTLRRLLHDLLRDGGALPEGAAAGRPPAGRGSGGRD